MSEKISTAENPSTPTSVLTTLASDINVEVRKSVAENPSTPASVLTTLRLVENTPISSQVPEIPQGQDLPGRKAVTASSIQRSADVSRWVKQVYNDTCQVCGTRLQIPGKGASDAAHIRGLGSPHNGPDIIENILCLCPNHHRTFDSGAWALTDDFKVKDLLTGQDLGSIHLHASHRLSLDCVRYQRDYWSGDTGV